MTDPTGMLTLQALETRVKAGDIDTVLVVFSDLYGRFMGKRYDAGFFLESVASEGTRDAKRNHDSMVA